MFQTGSRRYEVIFQHLSFSSDFTFENVFFFSLSAKPEALRRDGVCLSAVLSAAGAFGTARLSLSVQRGSATGINIAVSLERRDRRIKNIHPQSIRLRWITASKLIRRLARSNIRSLARAHARRLSRDTHDLARGNHALLAATAALSTSLQSASPRLNPLP